MECVLVLAQMGTSNLGLSAYLVAVTVKHALLLLAIVPLVTPEVQILFFLQATLVLLLVTVVT